MLPLERPLTASFGLVLACSPTPSAGRWPAAARADRRRARAELRSLGGEVVTGHRVDVARRAAAGAGRAVRRDAAPARWRSPATACRPATGAGSRAFRYGPGVFKVDWALDGPIPWTRRAPSRAGTVHLGGTLERDRRGGGRRHAGPASRPAVRPARPADAVADPTRAPAGKHVAWAYCHVPDGSDGRHDGRDRGPGRAVRARLPRPHPRPRRRRTRPRWRPTTPTTSAATSTAASGRAPAPVPPVASAGTRTRRPTRRAVPVLLVDPARRRGPRDERGPCGPCRHEPHGLSTFRVGGWDARRSRADQRAPSIDRPSGATMGPN